MATLGTERHKENYFRQGTAWAQQEDGCVSQSWGRQAMEGGHLGETEIKLHGHTVETDGILETADKLGLASLSSKQSLELLKEHTRSSCWQGGLGGAEQVGKACDCLPL